VGVVAATAVLAWSVGRVASDRFLWSQWLLWIPTPVAVLAAALGVVAALRRATRRRARLATWIVVTLLVLGYFAGFEHRFLRPAPEPAAGIRLVHWNLTHGLRADVDAMARRFIDLDPDVAVLTHAGRVPWTPEARRWLGETARPFHLGAFTIVSPFPILEARWIAAASQMSIALARIDPGPDAGGPLVIYLVDLPSDPRIPRGEMARLARRLIEQSGAPPPDVVVGDFNITRGSAALAVLFPDLRHAYDDAGRGYGASFRRGLPLYHIDHVLLGDSMRATSYELVDPGLTRHLIQVTELERSAISAGASPARSPAASRGSSSTPTAS
jgi:endonuclease/exonuclease/phosphatase family metal-dependent hydrolase